MARFFVTGATGFLGSHLAEALTARGDALTCLVRRGSDRGFLSGLAPTFVEGAIEPGMAATPELSAALAAADFVIHVAGLTKKQGVTRARFLEVNEAGTRAFAAICAEQAPNLRRFVLVSSLAATGPSRDGQPIDEARPPSPVSDYGISKLAGEAAVLALQGRLKVSIVRPPGIYGARDLLLLNLIRVIKRRIRPADSRLVNFVHASDVAAALIAVAEGDTGSGEVYNSGGEDITVAELGSVIAQALGRWALPVPIPALLMHALTYLGPLSPLDRDQVAEYTGAWPVSSRKLRERLSWSPQVRLSQGLPDTVAWYREAGLI